MAGTLIFFVVMVGILLLWRIEVPPVHAPYQPPGSGHLLGTDGSGRDLLALFLRSSATSLSLGLGAALLATLIGALIGCLAGYRRTITGAVLMRLTDIVMLIPALPLVIVLAAYLGPGAENVFSVISLTVWPSTARVIHARVLALREQPYIINARSMGAGTGYLIRRHILPNCSDLLLAKLVLTVAGAMLAESGISFLGLGDPLNPSWGSMLHGAFTGAALLSGAWWWIFPPLAGISLSVMLLYMLGHFLTRRQPIAGPPVAPFPDRHACAGDSEETGQEPSPLLAVEDLVISFPEAGDQPVVDHLDLTVKDGEKIAIIGASGSGKSLLLLSLLGLLPPDARSAGRISVAGKDLKGMDAAAMCRHRGVICGYIPQNGGTSLNPVLDIIRQVGERVVVHHGCSRRRAEQLAQQQLLAAGLPKTAPDARIYPHHLSGGMRQRALMAMARIGEPRLLLADEPTKGLDPDAVAAITPLFQKIADETLLVVTHDLAFALSLKGTIMVMLEGMLVEAAPAAVFSTAPLHPYSRALMDARSCRSMAAGDLAGQAVGSASSAGCPYQRLCRKADSRCGHRPPLETFGNHRVRCWQYVH